MPKNKKKTSDAVEILHRRYYDGKPDRISELEEARAEDELARKIYELREKMGLVSEKGNYARVWKKVNGAWKLVIDVANPLPRQ